MDRAALLRVLGYYFPDSFREGAPLLATPGGRRLIERLLALPESPLPHSQFNQLLHLTHEAGVTEGFFRYYFLTAPAEHPYPLDRVVPEPPPLDPRGIGSLAQLDWGLRRFFIDALLYFGSVRSAYRELRVRSYDHLVRFFAARRYDPDAMAARGPMLPLREIPVDDRYLISEMACRAYSPAAGGEAILVEQLLLDAYRRRGGGRLRVADLLSDSGERTDLHGQMLLEFAVDELADAEVASANDLHARVRELARRFEAVRAAAAENTCLYLSIANELDVYVATSMRRRDDFRAVARDCAAIFASPGLRRLQIRWFDPTLSAAPHHEDKGLLECLMVKCARALLYFAGESDSFGKDAEIAMALSLGKPVIILCGSDDHGAQRARFFRDLHPLSRLIDFQTGIPCGAMVTQDRHVAAELLERIFTNRMEYDLDHTGDGYLRLRERLTGSVVRLQSNFRQLRQTFFHYYHGSP